MRVDVGMSGKAVKFPICRSTISAARIMTARMTADPFALFDSWFAEARASEPNDANAMALATTTSDGHPSLRMVLLKGHGADGFVFTPTSTAARAASWRPTRTWRCSFTGSRCGGRSRIEAAVAPVDDVAADA